MEDWRDYAYIKMQKCLVIVPVDTIYTYLPSTEIEAGLKLGKAFERAKTKAKRNPYKDERV